MSDQQRGELLAAAAGPCGSPVVTPADRDPLASVLTEVAKFDELAAEGLGWEINTAREYVETLIALEAGAEIAVSDDADLTSTFPWRGRPVVRPAEFAQGSTSCAVSNVSETR